MVVEYLDITIEIVMRLSFLAVVLVGTIAFISMLYSLIKFFVTESTK